MGVFRSIEHRIESLVEGAFGRAFRSHVQPVELARKLAKEMDDHKTISVSRVYVPNEYVLYLSPETARRCRRHEALLTELSDYLSEHARREGYALLSTPRVLLEEDEDLDLGEFGIATRMVQRQRADGAAPPPAPAASAPGAPAPPAPPMVAAPEVGATRIFKPPAPDTAAVSAAEARSSAWPGRPPTLLVGDKRYELTGTTVLGRSRECDITVDDAEHLAPPCGDPPRGRRLLDRGPRLDERHRGERTPRRPLQAREQRPDRLRPDGRAVREPV